MRAGADPADLSSRRERSSGTQQQRSCGRRTRSTQRTQNGTKDPTKQGTEELTAEDPEIKAPQAAGLAGLLLRPAEAVEGGRPARSEQVGHDAVVCWRGPFEAAVDEEGRQSVANRRRQHAV